MTYTVTTELLVVILSALAVVVPCVYWLGRSAHRLDVVEKATAAMTTSTTQLALSIEVLRRELLLEIRRYQPLHTTARPMAGNSDTDA